MEPLKLSNINLDNIIYTKIKKNQDYKIILMKYNNNSQLRIDIHKDLIILYFKLQKY
jgi:hypothetical protein